MKYFIDIIKDDGTEEEGSIAWPAADALAIQEETLKEHPTWVVHMNKLEGTP